MKLVIGKQKKAKKNPISKFRIDIEFMYGDADGEGHEKLLISEDNPLISRYLKFLDKCKKLYKETGKGGYDDYTSVKDWYYFFKEDLDPEYDEIPVYKKGEEKWAEEFAFDWHTDPGSDGQCISSIEGYVVTHFDKNGVERKVTIKR